MHASIAGTVELTTDGTTEDLVANTSAASLVEVFSVKGSQVAVVVDLSPARALSQSWIVSYSISVNAHQAASVDFNATVASSIFEAAFSEVGVDARIERVSEPVQTLIVESSPHSADEAQAMTTMIAIATAAGVSLFVAVAMAVVCIRRSWGRVAGNKQEPTGKDGPSSAVWSVEDAVSVSPEVGVRDSPGKPAHEVVSI